VKSKNSSEEERMMLLEDGWESTLRGGLITWLPGVAPVGGVAGTHKAWRSSFLNSWRKRETRRRACRDLSRRTEGVPSLFCSLLQTAVCRRMSIEGRKVDVFGVEATGSVEAELDQFIEKRARDKAEANKEEEELRAAARRVREKRRRENRGLWIAHHGLMNVLHTGLCLKRADKRVRLMAEGSYEPDGALGPEAA
jgi:hypothetical protein